MVEFLFALVILAITNYGSYLLGKRAARREVRGQGPFF